MIARIAGRQDGVVGGRQLLAVGVSPRAVEVPLAAGRLYLLHRGVYAVGFVPTT